MKTSNIIKNDVEQAFLNLLSLSPGKIIIKRKNDANTSPKLPNLSNQIVKNVELLDTILKEFNRDRYIYRKTIYKLRNQFAANQIPDYILFIPKSCYPDYISFFWMN